MRRGKDKLAFSYKTNTLISQNLMINIILKPRKIRLSSQEIIAYERLMKFCVIVDVISKQVFGPKRAPYVTPAAILTLQTIFEKQPSQLKKRFFQGSKSNFSNKPYFFPFFPGLLSTYV